MTKVVIGVDISKSTLDCYLLRWGVKTGHHKSFLNKDFGYKQIIEWIFEHVETGESFFFCMEHTGYYGFEFCQFLRTQCISYAAINPLQIKHSMGFRREKTDKADSLVIAQYGLRTQEELFYNDNIGDDLLSLQVLVNYRKHLQKIEMGLSNRNKNINSCLSETYVDLILEDSQLLQKELKSQRKKVEKTIQRFIKERPELHQRYELLNTIPGVGPIIAWYLLIHTHNFQRINNPRKFACYCSVAPFKRQSGTSVKGATRVSTFGNRFIKSLLHLGAMNARKNDPELRAYYDKKMEEKKNHRLVMNALINKLIHRIFATVHRGTPYVIRSVY